MRVLDCSKGLQIWHEQVLTSYIDQRSKGQRFLQFLHGQASQFPNVYPVTAILFCGQGELRRCGNV
jgi:hypothetical protein